MGIQQLDDAKKSKGVADVVFCFDCTGSMTGVIDTVKSNVSTFVAGLTSDSNVVIDWQARAVGYGDFEVDALYIQNENPFSNNVKTVQDQIANISMVGGGDAPESTLDAICHVAMESNWRSNAHKIIVVFTDAPTKDINKITSDKFAIKTIDELKDKLMEKHVKLFLFAPADPNYKKLELVPKSEVKYENLASINLVKVLEQMGKTVSSESRSAVL